MRKRKKKRPALKQVKDPIKKSDKDKDKKDNPQDSTFFRHNLKHIIFAEAYVSEAGNISKSCTKAEIDRKTYYNWCKLPGFNEWLSEYAKDEVLQRWGKWYLIAEKHAERGSYNHLQLLFELAEKYTPTVITKKEEVSDEQIIAEFRKRGLPLPDNVIRFLKYKNKK